MTRRIALTLSCIALPMSLTLAACSDDDAGQNNTPLCGNALAETGEECDGADLGGASCESLGMTGTGLTCRASCTYDRSACTGCGNGTLEIGEGCDGDDFGTQTCANLGFTAGTLGCTTTCTVDLSGCTGGCGNGVVESGEQCDPPNGTTCDSSCQTIGNDECDEPDTYDTDCSAATTGQYCWDGGDGGSLFCGCDPDYGDEDCQISGYGLCNPTTMRCEATPDCGGDANEANDTETTATSLTSGVAVNGASCAYDDDWFEVTPADTALSILVAWTDDGESDLDVTVTDCAGAEITNSESSDPAQEALSVTGLRASTPVCILVYHYSGAAGGADVSYAITVTDAHGCALDSECEAGEHCPFVGSGAGMCRTGTPAHAGCGDNVTGDNDTSTDAETLLDGSPIVEGTCDGHPTGPVDVDWFVFDVAAGDHMTLSVDQAGVLTEGDVDVVLYDSTGALYAVRATTVNPETIAADGLPAGTYYAVVYYYDNTSSTAGSATYTISLGLTAGAGCADRDGCANLYSRGECTAGVCVPFEGAAGQGPGEFCDSSDDCDATTGSIFLSSRCFTGDRNLGSDNVCVIDCTGESDCTPHGMHCLIVDSTNTPPGICLAPCTSDAGCGGGGATCNTSTGICSF